jgi:hypothetical protein
MNRTSTTTVTFRHPFAIEGLEGRQPAGSYVVDTEEELVEGLSFPAWHRICTSIRLPKRLDGSLTEEVSLDPAALAAALAADAAAGEN